MPINLHGVMLKDRDTLTVHRHPDFVLELPYIEEH
jgi:hypothetical protein